MKLIIKVVDGQWVDHPVVLENFRTAFPDIPFVDEDNDGVPDGWVWFERVSMPYFNWDETVEHVGYEWVDGVVKDKWVITPMSAEAREVRLEQQRQIYRDRIQVMLDFAVEDIKTASDNGKLVLQTFIDQCNNFDYTDPFDPLIEDRIPLQPHPVGNGEFALAVP